MAKRRKETTERVGSDTRDRLKVFILRNSDIMSLLTWHTHEMVGLPIIEGLPKDATIREVEYRMECRGWALLVEHKSFPEVSQGSRVPYADKTLVTDMVSLTRNPDGTYTVPGRPYLATER